MSVWPSSRDPGSVDMIFPEVVEWILIAGPTMEKK